MQDLLKLVAGSANPALAQEISRHLGIKLTAVDVGRFPDGETSIYIRETVRGADVFIIQPTCPPVNDHLMELLLMTDALKRASAERITAVVPYYGYARQDRKHIGRVPISAKLVANMIVRAGAGRMLTLDLPAGQIQGFFDIPVDNLRGDPIIAGYYQKQNLEDAVIVAPDVGAAKRARAIAERLGLPIAIVEKSRVSPDEVRALSIIGEVKGKRAVLVDDILSTGGTITQAAKLLLDCGATEIYAAFTHGVFAGDAIKKLEESPIRKIAVTNTIPVPQSPKIDVIPVGVLLAETIKRIHYNKSVSEMFPHD
ncbi:ribose-phosphate pyrophosphokinase [Candidatus Acetothermia bacterium]|nr:ribose-phosphate pyrophosphokinase [Candidatus Acetothermia bacterium]MCI2431235.1 ribose-phosphate pyrophosphokinase [Candidatus Acetothermia bacterium]MCI2436848.1 ribose-phosphate pyrophosphokinase [Candidatus Acetothermia bacterium]